MPFSTAAGCISHAAPAISTVPRRRVRARRRTPGGSGQRERHRAPDVLGVGGGEHRASGVGRPLPAASAAAGSQRAPPALDRLAVGLAARPARRSAASTGSHSGTTGSAGHDPLGEQVARGAAEVVVEGRLVRGRLRATPAAAQPWISQPSAARAASITPSDSVGWPWMVRATSGYPPSSGLRVDELLDQLGRLRADDVAAEQLAVLLLADDLDQPGAVAVDGPRADRAVLDLADGDVVTLLARLRLGETEAGDVRRAERSPRDVDVLDRVGLAARRRPRPRSRPRRTPCGRARGRGRGRRSRRCPRRACASRRRPRSGRCRRA